MEKVQKRLKKNKKKSVSVDGSRVELDSEHVTVIECVDAKPRLFDLEDNRGNEEHDDDDDDDELEMEDEVDGPAVLTGGDFLETFCYPVSRDEFFKRYWQRKALVIRQSSSSSPSSRFSPRVLHEYLLDLDVDLLTQASPSEQIHVWLPTQRGVAATSFPADTQAALSCHRLVGASLYFRAPQPFTDALVSAALLSLGCSFAGWTASGEMCGEIETFFSRPGSVTNFHYDFQQNFTFQLQGSKKWTLQRTPVVAPSRGFTPHFTGMSREVREKQACSARMDPGAASWDMRIPEDDHEDDNVVEIVLNAGDCMYFPAGLLHRVETVSEEEDSISINVSVDPVSYGDYFADCVRSALKSREEMRHHIVTSRHQDLQRRLQMMKDMVQSMTVDQMFPAALLRKTPLREERVFVGQQSSSSTVQVGPKTMVKKNPLAVAVELPAGNHGDDDNDDDDDDGDGEQEQSSSRLVIYFNAANEDMDPWLRTELMNCDVGLFRTIVALAIKEEPFQVSAIEWDDQESTHLTVLTMIERGYLTVC